MALHSRSVALLGVLALVGCAQPPAAPPDTRADDEAAIRALVNEWSIAADVKDAERFASFYADDATVMVEGMPDIHGMAALREGFTAMMKDPSFSLSFAAEDVVVARSGDLAYETGSYSLTTSGPDGKPTTQKGHYVDVWRKNAQSEWKVVLDVPVSDPPEEAASE